MSRKIAGAPPSGARRTRCARRAFCPTLMGALVVTLMSLVLAVGGAAAQPADVVWRELPLRSRTASPEMPALGDLPVQLVLDDGSAEGAVGVGGLSARQFLWFQRFSPGPTPFALAEIWVLFPSEPQLVPGAAVQLAVYSDPDGNPESGAELLLALDETVQFANSSTFSVYTLDEPLLLPGGDVLIGVVNRYVESGVSAPSQPAAQDTSSSAGRAYLATWTGDPPDPPVFPPDQSLFLVDDLVPGNWMIRGFGEAPVVVDVPGPGALGASILALLLAGAGLLLLGRRA